MFNLQILIFSAIWVTSAAWTTTECSTTSAVSCTTTASTIIETQTIFQTAPPITALETSTVKSGTVLNTTQTATSLRLKPRDNKDWGSSWNIKSAKSWTDWEFCSPSTLTKTLTEYTTSIIGPSTTTKTLVETQPGMHAISFSSFL
jgi:hypothetical protein